MMSDEFTSGTIFLLKKPLSGRYGIPGILSKLLSGCFGIEYVAEKMEEIYLLFVTRNRKILLIFHADILGYDLSKRRLNQGTFAIPFQDDYNPEEITRDQLKRLVLDGTYYGQWRDESLRKQFEAYTQARPLPSAEET